MPENIPAPTGADSPDLASADAAAEAQARANREGSSSQSGSLRPDVSPDRMDDLDAAFKDVSATPEAKAAVAEANEKNVGRDNNGVRQSVEGEPTAEERAAAAQKSADEKVAADADKAEAARVAAEAAAKKPAAKKGLLGDVIDENETVADEPAKAYDDIKLRADASDATRKSFENQRARAIERESAVATKLADEQKKRLELETRITELEKSAGKPTTEVESELKELREFRAAHDVATRPEFKQKFDDQIKANEDAVFDLFKKEGMPEENIAKLRRMPEASRDEYLEKHVYPKLTSAQRRIIDAKLLTNTTLVEEKAKALEAARADAEKILSEQRTLPAKQLQERDNAVLAYVKPALQKLPYLHVVEIPATATEAQKKELEARNAFALELQENLKQGIIDDSPAVRAEAALAIPIARYLSRAIKTVTARAEAAEKQLAAIKAAGATSRLGRSSSPGAALAPVSPQGGDSEDAIDNLFRAANSQRSP